MTQTPTHRPVTTAGCAIAVWLAATSPLSAQTPQLVEFEPLVERLEAAVRGGDSEAYLALVADGADQAAARAFAIRTFRAGVDAAVARPLFVRPADAGDSAETGAAVAAGTETPSERYELMVEVFVERGITGELRTWHIDVVPDPATPRRTAGGAPDNRPPDGGGPATGDADRPVGWRILGQEQVDVVDGLLSLSLKPGVAYDAANLVLVGEDLNLRMSSGSAFVAETAEGLVTALVVLGDGVFSFTPGPEAERGQVRLLSGRETLETEMSAAYVRVNPRSFASNVSLASQVERPVSQEDFERAEALFEEFVALSFAVDLGDLSERTWSLTPSQDDLIAEVVTEEYGTLTYARASGQPEDVTLYTRDPERIISLYPSAEKLAVQGRYYSEDDNVAYDVLDYRITATFEPQGIIRESLRARTRLRGCVIEGRARIAVRVKEANRSTLTFRLSDDLEVLSVSLVDFGPLLHLRMRGRDNLVVSLPTDNRPAGTEFVFDITYRGLLPPQEPDENWIGRWNPLVDTPYPRGVAAHRYIYSNSSYWYPQSTVSDYATATMDLTAPAGFGLVASGTPDAANPQVDIGQGADEPRSYRFVTLQPARYLSVILSPFAPTEGRGDDAQTRPREIPLAFADSEAEDAPGRAGVTYDGVLLTVESTRRTLSRVADRYDDAEDILRFYASLIGDLPYPTFTLLLSDSLLPGGHSPAYFAILNQALPQPARNELRWQADPVAFSNYPAFFLAHEVAHQWWGQAVGWKNYHEQWLSEGLAQYFAALYAEHVHGSQVFEDVVEQMRDWSLRHSDQGPVYLGRRLGRITDEPRVFRAVVYNKGAMVLHMLRRTVGDATFFEGLRQFYREMRFRKAGTDDLIRVFEAVAGRSLTQFFERWIHDADLPDVTFSYRTERGAGDASDEAVLRFVQRGTPFEFPVTATLRYRGAPAERIVVLVAGEVTEHRVPLRGELRDVAVNQDRAALAEIE